MIAFILACGGATVEGTVTHGITKAPVEGVRVVAKTADEGASMTCLAMDSTTDAAGKYTLSLCGNSYTVSSGDPNLWFPDVTNLPADGGTVDIEAWPGTEGSGLYLYRDGALASVKTDTDIKVAKVTGHDDTIQYAKTVPEKARGIKEGEYLVIVGKELVDGLQFHRVIGSELFIEVGAKKGDLQVKKWGWLDVTFTSPTEYTTAAPPVPSGVIDKANAAQSVRFVPHNGVPKGVYALYKKGDRRLTFLEFP